MCLCYRGLKRHANRLPFSVGGVSTEGSGGGRGAGAAGRSETARRIEGHGRRTRARRDGRQWQWQ